VSRQLVLWRHGRTAWNLEGRTQGHSDIDPDEVGRAQAAESAPRLAGMAPDLVVSSDLRRARDTAAALAWLTGQAPTYDARLREMDFGDREGLTLDEAAAKWPEEIARWLAGDDVRLPGAETLAEVANRFAAALHDISSRLSDEGTAVLVTHGSAIRVGVCAFLGLPAAHWGRLGSLANCHWAILGEGARGWRIVEWNAGTLPEPAIGDDEQASGLGAAPDRLC